MSETPWLVAVTKGTPIYRAMTCGGALIDPYWVLTANHCIDQSADTDLRILVGQLDPQPDSAAELPTGAIREVSRSFPLSRCWRGQCIFDIVLLRLESPAPPELTTIEMAQPSIGRISGLVKTYGWSAGEGNWQESPRYATQLPLWTNPASLYGLALSLSGLVCDGDSGGPVVSSSSGKLEGIASRTLVGRDCSFVTINNDVRFYAPLVEAIIAANPPPTPTPSPTPSPHPFCADGRWDTFDTTYPNSPSNFQPAFANEADCIAHFSDPASCPSPAVMLSPEPRTTLPAGGSVTFSWTTGCGMNKWDLWLGTVPFNGDIFDAADGSFQSITAPVPTDGSTIYFRLTSSDSTETNGWTEQSSYTASGP